MSVRKTGTISGTSSLSGYVTTKRGEKNHIFNHLE
ncbi:D-alanyl-D-alanine carboxypeptidase [Peribacillus frigoritolerans]|nr:D-alanyl-D-alanine carboxypeptidase [Peribacillus frigoritolerans]